MILRHPVYAFGLFNICFWLFQAREGCRKGVCEFCVFKTYENVSSGYRVAKTHRMP